MILRSIIFSLILLIGFNSSSTLAVGNLLAPSTAQENSDSQSESGSSENNEQRETENSEEPSLIQLEMEEEIESMMNSYEGFFDETDLSSEFIGQLMLSSGVLFITFLALWAAQKFGFFLRNKMHAIRDKYTLHHDRFRYYARAFRYISYLIISLISIYTLCIVWGFTDAGISISTIGRYIIGQVINLTIILVVGIFIWELVNTLLEKYIASLDSVNSSRLLTLLPIVKNVLFVVFVIMFALVLLSEVGINIMPLLAGAGVLGIAVGFGAQTMVKDFLTGFTIILEDLIQVGDVASLGGKTGLVERITIRKVQLRDLSGIVYTVPFSEITIVENWTKDFSFYVMDIGVAYRENTDEVIGYLKEIDEEMREDDEFKDLIIEPLEILGVDAFAASAVIIKARLKTRPIKQWTVGREFNRRMKIKFDEKGVEIPFPHQTIYFGEDKQGKAPPAHIDLINKMDNASDLEKAEAEDLAKEKTDK